MRHVKYKKNESPSRDIAHKRDVSRKTSIRHVTYPKNDTRQVAHERDLSRAPSHAYAHACKHIYVEAIAFEEALDQEPLVQPHKEPLVHPQISLTIVYLLL